MLDLSRSIDLTNPNWVAAAPLLQGNIVKPHGRKHSALITFRIFGNRQPRAGLRALAKIFVKSAADQQVQADKKLICPNTVFGALYLSASGYKKLGFSDTKLTAAFPVASGGDWFRGGMAARAAELGDLPGDWAPEYRGKFNDAMLLLACQDPGVLATKVAAAKVDIAAFGRVKAVEDGEILRNPVTQQIIEPFGFADGIEMPTVLEANSTAARPAHAARDLILRDPFVSDPAAFGSFLVYRKLRQDVAAFHDAVRDLAGDAHVSQDYAGAMIVGRFKDGTPVSNSSAPDPAQRDAVPDFAHDLNAVKCPFHAHIRRVNPRLNLAGDDRVTSPLFRRGIPNTDAAGTAKGLLFLALQSNIGSSFGFIMQRWVQRRDFPTGIDIGTDSLLGRDHSTQFWPGASVPGGRDTNFNIGRHIQLLGGEFYFAPSVAFFTTLV